METNKFEFDDLSYSGIVETIDSNKETAKEYLVENFFKIEEQKRRVEILRTQLQEEEVFLALLEHSIDSVFNHMGFEKPMALLIDGGIIVITKSGISLEKNIL